MATLLLCGANMSIEKLWRAIDKLETADPAAQPGELHQEQLYVQLQDQDQPVSDISLGSRGLSGDQLPAEEVNLPWTIVSCSRTTHYSQCSL